MLVQLERKMFLDVPNFERKTINVTDIKLHGC